MLFVLMIRLPPRSTRPATLFPCPTLSRPDPWQRQGRPLSARGRRRREKGSRPAPARDRPMPHDPAFPHPDLFPDDPAAAADITVLVETAVTLLADLLEIGREHV